MEDQDEFLTVREVARQLRVSDDAVRRWIQNGEIAALALGKKPIYRIFRAEFTKKYSLNSRNVPSQATLT